MEKIQHINANGSNNSISKKDPRKWSLSSLFRRKKRNDYSNSDSSSAADDHKPPSFSHKRKTSDKRHQRPSKLNTFDHVVVAPNVQNSIDAINNSDKYMFAATNYTGSLDRRLRREHAKTSQDGGFCHSSSEDEPLTNTHYRSDESVNSANNRKSRAARTERYLRRLNSRGSSREGGRWLTQPVYSNFNQDNCELPLHQSAAVPASRELPPQNPYLRNARSLHQINYQNFPFESAASNPSPSIDSRSYSQGLDQPQLLKRSARCTSDDRLCRPTFNQMEQPRRFIRRHEADFHYVADTTPRSRKPIHIVEGRPSVPPPKPARTFSTDLNFSKSMPLERRQTPVLNGSPHKETVSLQQNNEQRGRIKKYTPSNQKRRSLSSSRASDIINNNNWPRGQKDDENVVNGRLCIKKADHYPSAKYQLHVEALDPVKSPLRKDYAKRSSWHHENFIKKPRNLEDALNELENMYKSMKLHEDDAFDCFQGTPNKVATNIPSCYQPKEDDCEPDIVRDDLLNRNIRHANSVVKVSEKQPPFGIPIDPIPFVNVSSYLQSEVDAKTKSKFTAVVPDIISDDLAFRNLRKDRDCPKQGRLEYPVVRKEKDPSNMFEIIQRGATKPSGALEDEDLYGFSVLHGKQHIPASTASKMYSKGAIFNLPSTLKSTPSVEKEKVKFRASVSLDSSDWEKRREMEKDLNQIANEAIATSERLGHDLQQLRLSSSTSPKVPKSISAKPILKEEVSEVTKAVKLCEEMFKNAADNKVKIKKLDKERLVEDMKAVAEAAKTCEKMLDDILTDKSPSPEAVNGRLEIKPQPAAEGPPSKCNKQSVQEMAKIYETTNQLCPTPPQNVQKRRPNSRVSSLYLELITPNEDGVKPKIYETGSLTVNTKNGVINIQHDNGTEKTPVCVKSLKDQLENSHKSAFVPVQSTGSSTKLINGEGSLKEKISLFENRKSKNVSPQNDEQSNASPIYENLCKTPEKPISNKVVSTAVAIFQRKHSREEEIDKIVQECEEYAVQQQEKNLLSCEDNKLLDRTSKTSSSLNLSDFKMTPYNTPSEDIEGLPKTLLDITPSVEVKVNPKEEIKIPESTLNDEEDPFYNSSEELAAIFGVEGSNEKSGNRMCANLECLTNLKLNKHEPFVLSLTNKQVSSKTPQRIKNTNETLLNDTESKLICIENNNSSDLKRMESANPKLTNRTPNNLNRLTSIKLPPPNETAMNNNNNNLEITKAFEPNHPPLLHTNENNNVNKSEKALKSPKHYQNNNGCAFGECTRKNERTSTSENRFQSSFDRKIDQVRSIVQPEYMFLACSAYSFANVDYLSLLAIIIAIITLFAILSM